MGRRRRRRRKMGRKMKSLRHWKTLGRCLITYFSRRMRREKRRKKNRRKKRRRRRKMKTGRERMREGHARYKQTKALINNSSTLFKFFFPFFIHHSYSAPSVHAQ